ncbi:MAG TPA: hypothetical protein VEY51_11750, partial [Chondromyces sp.]|nr:hypothetical protein [Chondromyces sp.]
GAVDFVPELTDGLTKRYFIKGRPGSGKSTMLKKIASAAQEKGFDTEIYHCGFDPNSLDMVIVRELGFAIFDSTAPHEYFPEKPSDEIVDMYPGVIKEGTDEDYAKEIADIAGRYKNKMAEGTAYLTREKELHDELERIYVQAMDFDKVKEIQQKIKKEINQLLEQL